MTLKKMKSILFMLLGLISLAFGLAGTVLPVLPGGPFYLFAAYCFAKSSKRIENWFKSTTIYEKYVTGFLQKKGMTRREKIRINVTADFFILISVVFVVDILFVQVLLIGLALFKHYYFVKKIKTIPPGSGEEGLNENVN